MGDLGDFDGDVIVLREFDEFPERAVFRRNGGISVSEMVERVLQVGIGFDEFERLIKLLLVGEYLSIRRNEHPKRKTTSEGLSAVSTVFRTGSHTDSPNR